MAKILKIMLAVLAAAFSLTLSAQDEKYEPLTTWPYVYKEFSPGSITTLTGTCIDYELLNVNVINGKVHYVKNGTIMEAAMGTVATVNIGGDLYMKASGELVKVLRKCGRGAVACSIKVDTEAMNKSDIGYGKSSLASTQNLSLGALDAGVQMVLNKSLDSVSQSREGGEPLIVRNTKGIVYQGAFILAVRTEILNIDGIDRESVKKFIKDNKIKFSKVEDLAKLADYIYSL